MKFMFCTINYSGILLKKYINFIYSVLLFFQVIRKMDLNRYKRYVAWADQKILSEGVQI